MLTGKRLFSEPDGQVTLTLTGSQAFGTGVVHLTYEPVHRPQPDWSSRPVHHDPVNDEAGIGWIREVVVDCEEPWALARFWAGLLGGTPVEWYPGWVTLEPPPHGQRLSFQATATPLAQQTSRVHFDILVQDLTAAHDRVVSAGAVPVAEHVSPRPGPTGEPVPWRVYRDPAGHPFCLVIR
jgi:Glyoxalase-like domain